MIVQNSSSQAVPSASSLPISTPAPASVSAHTTVVQSSANVSKANSANTPVPAQSLRNAVAAVNESLSRNGSSLQFAIDRELDVAVVTMVDSSTGEVIRQIPSEEALAIARSIEEMLQRNSPSCESGILCKQTA